MGSGFEGENEEERMDPFLFLFFPYFSTSVSTSSRIPCTAFCASDCTSLLGPPKQSPTDCISSQSRGQKSKFKVSASLVPPEASLLGLQMAILSCLHEVFLSSTKDTHSEWIMAYPQYLQRAFKDLSAPL